MSYQQFFEIHELPKMANGAHGSWKADYGKKMRWRKMVGQCLLGKVPRQPLKRARVIFTRASSSEPDYDGLVHGFKPIRDALVHWGVLEDDKPRNLEGIYRWEKTRPKQGKVRVEIEELTSDTGPGANDSRSGAVSPPPIISDLAQR